MTVPEAPALPGRSSTLDALRGFDMLWLIGGAHFARELLGLSSAPWTKTLALQFDHVEWAGFRFYDFIFPLFLFAIGASIPYAVAKRRERGDSLGSIYGHALVRAGLMIFFGMMVNGKLLTFDPNQFQLTYSVLQMLALGYLVALVCHLHLPLKGQIAATAALLVVYWALLTFVPLPAGVHRVGIYAPHANVGDWLNDRILGDLQGRWRFGWILAILPHGATAMLGVFAAHVLRGSWTPARKAGVLAAIGAGCLVVGGLWSLQFPIIKDRWTSTFALWAGGWSYLLIALFSYLIDVRGWRGWARPLVVIGMNSFVAYMIATLFKDGFRATATKAIGGLQHPLGPPYAPLHAALSLGLVWLFLYLLYRAKIFVRL